MVGVMPRSEKLVRSCVLTHWHCHNSVLLFPRLEIGIDVARKPWQQVADFSLKVKQ